MERESFIFYKFFFEAIDSCGEDKQLLLYRAIVNYALYREEPDLDAEAKAIFLAIKKKLDLGIRNYLNGCQAPKEGKKRGAPKGNRNAAKDKRKRSEPQSQKESTENTPSRPLSLPSDYSNEFDCQKEQGFFEEYFSENNYFLREQFIMGLRNLRKDISTDDDLKKEAQQIMNRWQREKYPHPTYSEWVRHLENTLRKSKRNNVENSKFRNDVINGSQRGSASNISGYGLIE